MIPKYLDPDMEHGIGNAMGALDYGVDLGMKFKTIANMAMGQSMSELLGLVRPFQYITNISLANLAFPP